jgi:hypothetical protein
MDLILLHIGTTGNTNDVSGKTLLPCKEPKRPRPAYGMSPKKDHEVACMSAFVADLLKNWTGSGRVRHVVDIGAGQVCTLSITLSKHHFFIYFPHWHKNQPLLAISLQVPLGC